MKKFFLFVLVFFYSCSVLAAAAYKPLNVMLDWLPNPDQAPLFVAEEFGFFKKVGLTVNLIPPADPSDPPKLAAAEKVDLALSYQPQMMIQIDQGLPLIQVATLIAMPLDCLVASSDIKNLSELKGKTIGYSSSATQNVALAAMLNQAGLTLNDVKLINVHYNLTQAFLSHRIDAAMGMMRNFELIELHLQKFPLHTFYPEEHGMPLYDELIIITNKNKVSDPRLPKFITALTLATAYLINHPQSTLNRFIKAHPELNTELTRKTWFETLSRFALRPAALDVNRFKNYANFLYQRKVIKKILPVEDYATTINTDT